MDNYLKKTYDTKDRFVSYWQQINMVLGFEPASVLVVGKGNGLIEWYLKKKVGRVVSIDIDESLEPDVVGDVRSMPFQDNEFDVVLCAEVLEHLPYEDLRKSLTALKRVAKEGVVLSLPHWGYTFKIGIKIPFLGELNRVFKLCGSKEHVYKGEHYWEIGKRGYSLKSIIKEIEGVGYEVKQHFVEYGSPYHHFFKLLIK
jgi:ubiquinone/menaquinone biosynthesis C-methylase UbiE